MTAVNEAAEKLREQIRWHRETGQTVISIVKVGDLLEDALATAYSQGARALASIGLTDDHELCDRQQRDAIAAERRATVKRIRAKLTAWGYEPLWSDMEAILDEVAG